MDGPGYLQYFHFRFAIRKTLPRARVAEWNLFLYSIYMHCYIFLFLKPTPAPAIDSSCNFVQYSTVVQNIYKNLKISLHCTFKWRKCLTLFTTSVSVMPVTRKHATTYYTYCTVYSTDKSVVDLNRSEKLQAHGKTQSKNNLQYSKQPRACVIARALMNELGSNPVGCRIFS